jgi:hypothetical protein
MPVTVGRDDFDRSVPPRRPDDDAILTVGLVWLLCAAASMTVWLILGLIVWLVTT